MTELIPITVKTHSGYKADEYPVSFMCNGQEILITGTEDRWYQGDSNPEIPAADYFRVSAADGSEYMLRHELAADTWFLLSRK